MTLDNGLAEIAGAQPAQLLNRWIFACRENPVKDVYIAGQQRIFAGQHPCRTVAGKTTSRCNGACNSDVLLSVAPCNITIQGVLTSYNGDLTAIKTNA
ncbi:hypothetical protein [Aliamphritea spongicola]|nr:hypothetical protein [Aliamphritea spongicola]